MLGTPKKNGCQDGSRSNRKIVPDQYNRKLTSTLIITATGLPSFIAGSNFHCFTASMAFSSRPRPRVRATRMSRGWPSGPTTSHNTQVPCNFALRASSAYSGSGVNTARGAETPPPTLNTPPPIPPPRPGPTPGPSPEPTPPPLPEPMPPPDPVPFDGGPEGKWDMGSPKLGRFDCASLISGGMTTVGSTASLGF